MYKKDEDLSKATQLIGMAASMLSCMLDRKPNGEWEFKADHGGVPAKELAKLGFELTEIYESEKYGD